MLFINSYGQESVDFSQPNYENIEKEISKKRSDFYYPKLMEKFQKGDSTMTIDEKRHLYYGFQFQDGYNPYARSTYKDSLQTVLKEANPTKEDMKDIIRFGDLILAENPFELRTINYQLYAYEHLQMEEAFHQKLQMFRSIIDAIFSSGNGLTEETAYYVIYVAHEYIILEINEYTFEGQSLIHHKYDYMEISENPDEVKGLYFDVSASLNSMSKMFEN
ncbi:hypothetical protein NBRC110019_15780 [Neptunitalea chrysea]|uniref:DUF4919 domain-containing protein n=2 Tax=Neptunitalea chrysea TaxID=1647581 RepID=A0A9W6EW76_9FLAO|nr:hypothetical protein NBRC110019_15780 [Neptunitalea chrysea]